MVLPGRVGPGVEPWPERGDHLVAGRRVPLQDRPFLVGELAFLVQDFGRNRQLADVVQKHTPAQPVHVPLGQAHLVADELGVRANPFGVTARQPLVASQFGDERDRLLSRGLHRVARQRLPCPQFLHGAAS